jgi:hypothetical protein
VDDSRKSSRRCPLVNEKYIVVDDHGRLYLAGPDEIYLEPDGTLTCTFGGDEPLPAYLITEEPAAVG